MGGERFERLEWVACGRSQFGRIADMRRHEFNDRDVLLAALSAASLSIASCQSTGKLVMARAQREDTCGAKPLRGFIGRKADQATREAMENIIAPRRPRWITPDDDIIADLNTGRINVQLADDGAIVSIACF